MSAVRPFFHRKRKLICDLAMSWKCQSATATHGQGSTRHSPNDDYGMSGAEGTYSGLMPVNLTTLPHFSVSAAI